MMDVKQALRDTRFRESLGVEFNDDVHKYLKNPGCACNVPFYRRLLKEAGDKLKAYFPGREPADLEAEAKSLAKNNFSVINCHKDELQDQLRKLGPGRKQIAVTRFEDQITVIVNELDLIF